MRMFHVKYPELQVVSTSSVHISQQKSRGVLDREEDESVVYFGTQAVDIDARSGASTLRSVKPFRHFLKDETFRRCGRTEKHHLFHPRIMVWSRSGPTAMMLMGTPVMRSRYST